MNVLIGYMIDGKNSGIDKYLLRVLSVLREEKIHADILTAKDNETLRTCLAPFGADVVEMPGLAHPVKQYRAMEQCIKDRRYDVAYFNISEPMNCIGAMAAHRLSVPRVVIHSHSTAQVKSGPGKDQIKSLLNRLARRQLRRFADAYYACSRAAGKWLFPASVWKSAALHVLYNPVEIEAFAYQESVRQQYRHALGLENAVVIGHIGNFLPPKNSAFLLDILEKTRRKLPNAVLLSVGDGPQRQQIMDSARAMGLWNAVRFLGIRDDVPALLQAMDFFVLPSLFEGLPVSAIEAQAAGLMVLLSNRITDEVQCSELCRFLSIAEDGSPWAEAIVENLSYARKDFRMERDAMRRFDLDAQKQNILRIFQAGSGYDSTQRRAP